MPAIILLNRMMKSDSLDALQKLKYDIHTRVIAVCYYPGQHNKNILAT